MDKQEAIKKVLDGFDFTKVKKVMWLLRHTWMGKDGEYHPSVKEMRETAERLLSLAYGHALDGRNAWAWTNGGFRAYAYYYEEENSVDLELTFSVDSKMETVDRIH